MKKIIIFLSLCIFLSLKTSLQVFSEQNFTYEKYLEYMGKRFAKLQDSQEYIDNLPEDFGFKKSIENALGVFVFKEKIKSGFSIKDLLDKGELKTVIEKIEEFGKLDLSKLEINSLEGLDELINLINLPILELDLSDNNLVFVPKFINKKLIFLKTLSLSYNNIEFIEKRAFDIFKNLKHLDLGRNELIFLDINIFNNLTKLKTIDLSDNNFKDLDINIFKNLKKLEFINLADNKIDKEMFLENFKNLNLKKLKEVYLKSNNLN